GHNAGDQLIKAVGRRLASCMRDGDTIARLGGDEFIMVVPAQDDGETITRVMERILGNMSKPFDLGDREYATTCSIGIALYPQDGADAETLLKHADAAMYRAKELGRDRFQFYALEMNTRINERLMIES